jgi:hypothetical protein
MLCCDEELIMTALAKALGLKPAKLKLVEKKARQSGKSPREYVRNLIDRDLLTAQWLDDVLRPVRQTSKKNGITEAEVDELVKEARLAHLQKTQRGRRK